MRKINKVKDNTESLTWKDIDSFVNEDEDFWENPILATKQGGIYSFKNGFFFLLVCVYDHSSCTMTIIKDDDSKKWGQGTTTSMKCLFGANALLNSIDKEYECPIELIGLNGKDNQKV